MVADEQHGTFHSSRSAAHRTPNCHALSLLSSDSSLIENMVCNCYGREQPPATIDNQRLVPLTNPTSPAAVAVPPHRHNPNSDQPRAPDRGRLAGSPGVRLPEFWPTREYLLSTIHRGFVPLRSLRPAEWPERRWRKVAPHWTGSRRP